jgi:uncharacterized protein YbaP (TraB family)
MRSGVLVALLLTATAVQAGAQQGLLFRIQSQSPEAADSWLFGTIHSEDPRVTRLPQSVADAIDESAGLVLEVVPDAKMAEVSRAAMMLGPDQRLSELIPDAIYRQTRAALGAQGMPPEVVDRLRPWAALLLLSTPPSSGEPVLDLVLYQRALASGKPVQGLESIDEQLAVFGGLSLPDQITLLSQSLEEREELPRIFGALVDAYLARDLAQLMELGRTLVSNDPAVDARLRAALIDERNARMFERLLPLVRQGSQFLAVGALHLPGDGGLLERLEAQGFEVERVY